MRLVVSTVTASCLSNTDGVVCPPKFTFCVKHNGQTAAVSTTSTGLSPEFAERFNGSELHAATTRPPHAHDGYGPALSSLDVGCPSAGTVSGSGRENHVSDPRCFPLLLPHSLAPPLPLPCVPKMRSGREVANGDARHAAAINSREGNTLQHAHEKSQPGSAGFQSKYTPEDSNL